MAPELENARRVDGKIVDDDWLRNEGRGTRRLTRGCDILGSRGVWNFLSCPG